MAQEKVSTTAVSKKRPWSDETLFQILGDSFRCQIIGSLSGGVAKTPTELGGGSGLRRHAYLKHLSLMHKAGILVQKENPKDRRQPLYTFGPAVIVNRTEKMTTIDLGAAAFRFPQG